MVLCFPYFEPLFFSYWSCSWLTEKKNGVRICWCKLLNIFIFFFFFVKFVLTYFAIFFLLLLKNFFNLSSFFFFFLASSIYFRILAGSPYLFLLIGFSRNELMLLRRNDITALRYEPDKIGFGSTLDRCFLEHISCS